MTETQIKKRIIRLLRFVDEPQKHNEDELFKFLMASAHLEPSEKITARRIFNDLIQKNYKGE